MRPVRWWQFGLFGAAVLSIATAGKLARAIVGGAGVPDDWREFAGFAAAVFGIGFLCGVVVWAGRWLHRWLGTAGDALVGVAVMLCFFVSCMALFDPEALGAKFRPQGALMLGLAVVIGLIGGPWLGRDLRKESAQSETKAAGESEDEDSLRRESEAERGPTDDRGRPSGSSSNQG
jgi:hypothetical protein